MTSSGNAAESRMQLKFAGLELALSGLVFCLVASFVAAVLFTGQALASDVTINKADRKCIACHKRRSFKEQPPAGEEWQVHIKANEFIQAPHAELSCKTCHDDILKTPHRKNVERTVDCISCHRRHPEFVLRDADGQSVLTSGNPLSSSATCGFCHDTGFIEESSDHADAGASQLFEGERAAPWMAGPGFFGGWDPIRYDADVLDEEGNVDTEKWLKRFGARHIGGGPVHEFTDMNCLMCHTDIDDHSARAEALAEGENAWANSLPLQERGILAMEDGQWKWNPDTFQDDGRLRVGLIDIENPTTAKCAQCHGQASSDADTPLELALEENGRDFTEKTGQIIAPHPVNDSGLNLVGTGENDHPLDVHAAGGLQCVNCHYSLNNPIFYRPSEENRPAHLTFDPRRPDMDQFLDRPTHQIAKGRSIHGLAAEESVGSARTCKSCHDATESHEWLPYHSRHFSALACETCHIPKLYGPALKAIDWTILDASGEPIRQYRGVEGGEISQESELAGFQPVVLPRLNGGDTYSLAPFNAVASWFWLTGEPPRPVSRDELRKALLVDGGHHPDLVAGLDNDGDGQLTGDELQLQTAEQQDIVRRLLGDAGLSPLTVETELTPFSINHNVVTATAIRECTTCHNKNSLLNTEFPLSSYMPGGQAPSSEGYASVQYSGSLMVTEGGGVSGVPDVSQDGFYIIGLDAIDLIDRLGLLLLIMTILGVTGHGSLRYLARRKRERERGVSDKPRELKKVYMYDTYERIWHWVQAFMILYLLFSGLVIHKPHLFGNFSFPLMVDTHNIFGFILLANAALALFYNLASGRFKQYLPEPKDFFGRSFTQALYYMQGIFKGEHHPFEKTKHERLNPLQEVTYFGILNVLLPAQVITGLMIYWGQQNWPIVFTSLGGLPVLAPVHTAVAWLFATFIVMHIYLATASGHKSTAAIKSMITGWEEVEERPVKAIEVAAEAAEAEEAAKAEEVDKTHKPEF